MTARAFVRQIHLLTILVLLTGDSWAVAQEIIEPPPNAPAAVEWDVEQERLRLLYHGIIILDATVQAEDADGHEVKGVAVKLEPTETVGDKVETANQKETATIRIVPSATKTVDWRMTFAK